MSGRSQLRIGLDRRFAESCRGAELTIEKRQITEIVPRVRRARIQGSGLLVGPPRLAALADRLQNGSEGVMRRRRVRCIKQRSCGMWHSPLWKSPVAPYSCQSV